jgi:hypothetical protein
LMAFMSMGPASVSVAPPVGMYIPSGALPSMGTSAYLPQPTPSPHQAHTHTVAHTPSCGKHAHRLVPVPGP